MYNSLADDPQNELLRDRFSRQLSEIRALLLSTREEYQADVYSRVNRILSLGNHMRPLTVVMGGTPAVVGDVVLNLLSLNQDGSDIANQLLRVEDSVARLYNLAAASQNTLRQQIREAMYTGNGRRYVEAFIHGRNLSSTSATVDFNAGVATLPLVSESELKPTYSIGTNSVGSTEVGVDALTDNQIETALVFNGTSLELILNFVNPEIVNRIKIELDDYQGLEITSLTSSPDGTVFEDVLADLGVRTLLLNGTVGKYSGDCILDFPPRHARQIRIVIEDRVDVARIALRGMSIWQRVYGSAATLTSVPIYLTPGPLTFSTVEASSASLTSISHQISSDGVHFVVAQPGVLTLSSPFWYKATLQRGVGTFGDSSAALIPPSSDPSVNDNYSVRRSSSVSLGAGVIERTLVIENITGPIVFRDVPLPNSFNVQEGSVYLTGGEFTFDAGVLSFAGQKALITVTYQTSALGSAALETRRTYYSPLLYEARFEVI